jgi:xanthine dehydrogenase accessory factor
MIDGGAAMDFFDRLAELKREGRAFAVATVVARKAPVSSHLGDRAIVLADGRMEGFIGGSCSRDIVRRQALEVLGARQARLVSIRPDAAPQQTPDPEHVVIRMGCASEGAVDVYIEPHVPPRRLLVAGATPVATAIAALGRTLQYDVARVADRVDGADVAAEAAAQGVGFVALDTLAANLQGRPADAAVVATQGHYDEEALDVLLRADVPYVGLLASRKRGAVVKQYLADKGVPGLERLLNPAGLDLGARTPPEIALSILAEIVQRSPGQVQPHTASGMWGHQPVTADGVEGDASASPKRPASAAQELPARPAADQSAAIAPLAGDTVVPPPGATVVDPVCGMEVDTATARHMATLNGVDYYFCCPHCREHFLREPELWLGLKT